MSKMPRNDYNGSKDVPLSNEVFKRVNTQNSPYSVQATGHEHYQDKLILINSANLDALVVNTRVLDANRKGYVRSVSKNAGVLQSAVLAYAKRSDSPILKTPVNTAFTTGAGTLAIGTYYYRVSAIDANGETLASAETSHALTAAGGVNVNWGAVAGATGYKVYGRATGAELLIASVGAVTTFLDNGSIAPAGALPTKNTTSSQQTEEFTKAEILNSSTLAFAKTD